MPTLQIRRFEQIIQRMATRVVARTELTDLTDSSVLKQILAACAREIDDVYFGFTRLRDLFDLYRAVGEDLDARAKEIQPAAVTRQGALKAIGRVVFSRASNTGSTLVIPAGTTITSTDGKVFSTTEAAYITNTSPEQITGHGVGRDSTSVLATATTSGADGNVGIGAIVGFKAKPPGLSEVTNTTTFTRGQDAETDDAFRDRIVRYIAGLARSTPDSLVSAVVGLESDTGKRVIFAHAFEDPTQRGNVTLYIDDGAGTASEIGSQIVDEVVMASALGDEEFLQLDTWPISLDTGFVLKLNTVPQTLGTDFFINPANGQIYFPAGLAIGDEVLVSYYPYEGLIPVVQKVVDGDTNDRLNYPGYRAAGVRVLVKSPVVVPISVQAILTLTTGTDELTAQSEAVSAVLDYINNLGISGDVIRHEVVDRIMEVDGVYDVDLIAPSTNITINDDQIARASTSTVSVA